MLRVINGNDIFRETMKGNCVRRQYTPSLKRGISHFGWCLSRWCYYIPNETPDRGFSQPLSGREVLAAPMILSPPV